jgi:hypothetical protein
MLLTVFGMLSGNGNKRQKHNKQAVSDPVGYPFSLTTASKRESIVFYTLGQVSWLVTLLPSFSFCFGLE